MSSRSHKLFKRRSRRVAFQEEKRQAEAKPNQACPTGKKIYKKKERARAAARKSSARLGIPIRFYRCRICRWFHRTRGEGENPETGRRDGPKIRRLILEK